MSLSFGLDLAGYSSTCSVLAVSSQAEPTSVTILTSHCLCVKRDGGNALERVVSMELECVGRMLMCGHLYVDVPIDLQGLPAPDGKEYLWQLIKRPVDKAFEALPPLASLIGSYVARMQNLRRSFTAAYGDPLGSTLLETYPAASLELSGLPHEKYKGRANYRCDRWEAVTKPKGQAESEIFASLLNGLGWTAPDGFHLTHDEFDAAICALTGVGDQLRDAALDAEIQRRLGSPVFTAPAGYVLLRGIPRGIELDRQEFAAAVAE